jgi:hypothetical protein
MCDRKHARRARAAGPCSPGAGGRRSELPFSAGSWQGLGQGAAGPMRRAGRIPPPGGCQLAAPKGASWRGPERGGGRAGCVLKEGVSKRGGALSAVGNSLAASGKCGGSECGGRREGAVVWLGMVTDRCALKVGWDEDDSGARGVRGCGRFFLRPLPIVQQRKAQRVCGPWGMARRRARAGAGAAGGILLVGGGCGRHAL